MLEAKQAGIPKVEERRRKNRVKLGDLDSAVIHHTLNANHLAREEKKLGQLREDERYMRVIFILSRDIRSQSYIEGDRGVFQKQRGGCVKKDLSAHAHRSLSLISDLCFKDTFRNTSENVV